MGGFLSKKSQKNNNFLIRFTNFSAFVLLQTVENSMHPLFIKKTPFGTLFVQKPYCKIFPPKKVTCINFSKNLKKPHFGPHLVQKFFKKSFS